MMDYWQYKTVHYWANVVRNKQAFCMNADFFKTAEVVLPEAVEEFYKLALLDSRP